MFGISVSPLAKAYLAPFTIFMALLALGELVAHLGDGMAAWPLAEPRYWIFPLQTFVCGVALVRWWRCYDFQWRRGFWSALGMGTVVLLIWISPQWLPGAAPRVEGFDPYFFGGGLPFYLNTFVRVLRLVVVVPLLEEIFWRGFLLRHLIRDPFDEVPFGSFSWPSFLWVTFFFGVAHWGPDFWPAIATGALYNLLAVRTRSLGACVIAHGLTNLLLGAYIFQTGQWGFW
jgi:CAAX prenyl protease-like protein